MSQLQVFLDLHALSFKEVRVQQGNIQKKTDADIETYKIIYHLNQRFWDSSKITISKKHYFVPKYLVTIS